MITIFKKIKTAWMFFAGVMEKITTTVILSVIYFLIIGVYAYARRISARFIHASPRVSTWEPYDDVPVSLSELSREF